MTVIVGRRRLVEVIREIAIAVGADGEAVTPTIGPSGEGDFLAGLLGENDDLRRRVGALERRR